MKRIFTLFSLLIFVVLSGYAQNLPSAASPEILTLKEQGFDFGKIPRGRPVTHNFEVTNNSKAPLVIGSVEASCGCTSPEWSSQPMAPGASSQIKVGFNAAIEGPFKKTITILFNGGQSKIFTISGEVYPSPATSAPLNTSLSFIK